MALTDQEIREHLEPEVKGMPMQMATEISLAISMKRIADAITYQPVGGENVYDMLNSIRRNTAPIAR
jgi:hypothetical protein